MTGNSRFILFLGASLLVIAFAGMSTVSGDGWVIPMATLLSGILLILVFSFITIKEDSKRGSTPFKPKLFHQLIQQITTVKTYQTLQRQESNSQFCNYSAKSSELKIGGSGLVGN